MKLKVWIVVHEWGDRDGAMQIRGLYRSEAAARTKAAQHETYDLGSRSAGGVGFREHGPCCEVAEMFVEDEPAPVYHGPSVPYLGPPREASALSEAMTEVLTDLFTRRFPVTPSTAIVHEWSPDPELTEP